MTEQPATQDETAIVPDSDADPDNEQPDLDAVYDDDPDDLPRDIDGVQDDIDSEPEQ